MAHFAELDDNNVVQRVIVVNDDYLKDENGNEVESLGRAHLESVHGGKWVQTSYNHNIRGRYAGIGYLYNENLDVFITPKPHNSWILNEETANWESPIPMPVDGNSYNWNEDTQSWDLIETQEL